MDRKRNRLVLIVCMEIGLAIPACSVGVEAAQPAAVTAAAIPEKDLARTRLTVIRPGKDVGARTVVALAKPTSSADVNDEGGRFQPLLAREMIRQAVLIAARDELGLGTRDEVLGDRPPDGHGRRSRLGFPGRGRRESGPDPPRWSRGGGAAPEPKPAAELGRRDRLPAETQCPRGIALPDRIPGRLEGDRSRREAECVSPRRGVAGRYRGPARTTRIRREPRGRPRPS